MPNSSLAVNPWPLFAALFMLFSTSGAARLVELTILHTTDLHGHVLPSYTYVGQEDVGGFLRCASYIEEVRKTNPHALYLDCGDLTQGGIESYLSKGLVMTRALELARCDAWVIGNHELDSGVDALEDLLGKTKLTRLGANFRVRPGEEPLLKDVAPFRIFERQGIRIAVVGLTTPGIPYWSRPFLLKQLRVISSVQALEEVWPEVKKHQPDIIVVAAHQGLKPRGDDFSNEIGAIARSFPEIDLILGGHSHRVVELDYIHDIPYAQAGYHANWVGRVDVSYDTVEQRVTGLISRVVEISTNYPPANELMKELIPQLDRAKEFSSKPIGSLQSALAGRSPVPGHSAQQQLICDAIRHHTRSDFVIHGAFSDKIFPAGVFTQGMLWRMIPYENKIGILHVTKEELKMILEENAAKLKSFYFMGNSGFHYDLLSFAPAGERISSISLPSGKALHPRKRYRLALNSYVLASGGQRYPRTRYLADQPITRLEWTGEETRAIVRSYLKTNPDLDVNLEPGLTVVRREKVTP
jgi:2',3'-cyclic-nucleotide 2'-phosphodiesterase/3'-nucleotidase